jgi:hypothetical protein
VTSSRTPPNRTLPSLGGAGVAAVTTMTSTSEVAGSSASAGSQAADPARNAPANAGTSAACSATHREVTARESPTRI